MKLTELYYAKAKEPLYAEILPEIKNLHRYVSQTCYAYGRENLRWRSTCKETILKDLREPQKIVLDFVEVCESRHGKSSIVFESLFNRFRNIPETLQTKEKWRSTDPPTTEWQFRKKDSAYVERLKLMYSFCYHIRLIATHGILERRDGMLKDPQFCELPQHAEFLRYADDEKALKEMKEFIADETKPMSADCLSRVLNVQAGRPTAMK